MGTIERIELMEKKFYEKRQDNISYRLDPATNILYITYEDNFLYKNYTRSRAHLFIKKFRERKLSFFGNLLGTVAILSIVFGFPLWIAIFLQDKNFISGIETIEVIILLLILSIILIWIGSDLMETVSYFKDSKCKKCGKDFACDEFKKPEVKEVSSLNLYDISLTRYWKCKFCENIDCRTESVKFTYKKGSIDSLSTQTCSVCKKEDALEVYKNPDIKEVGSRIITIRHYMCKSCNNYGIEIETEIENYD